jgi:hypothetical protein
LQKIHVPLTSSTGPIAIHFDRLKTSPRLPGGSM